MPGPGANAQLQKDDILLLCSDGFWGPLRTGQLLRGLEGPSLRQCILELSDIAERRAGSHGDNLSVLAMQWQDQELSVGDGSATRPESRKADAAGGSQHSESGNG
ncbi:MAG: hypothetical protein EP300_04150 [Gammaproteobacteria bacterium]|nr:MAG: hypothetical protein EP300_04150 [Gammaproteobacteria bacterium]